MYLKKPYIIDAKITSPFGERIHPITKQKKFHKGVDIALPESTQLYAPLAGTIISGFDKTGYGNYALINSLTEQGTKVQFLFGHLNRVLLQGIVKQNELFALSGNTGASTGAHLHFEVRIYDGKEYIPQDPTKYVNLA